MEERMEGAASSQQPQAPSPDPALKVLDQFVGTWDMRGHFLGSDEENIVGRATYRWLEGGFFLQQDIELDLAGQVHVKSHELIGYDPETKTFSSLVYSNLSPVPLPYTWDVRGRDVTISVSYGPLDATFTGAFGEDGNQFSGGWRPNPGADETVNPPYDIAGTRVE
jgi:Protein of unknown function (DUF1579)